jgi:hypothetical protein
VVINEVMYHPLDTPSGTNQVDNTADEFIELWNASSAAVSLFSTNGVWRLDGEAEFLFPPNTTLGPGGYLVIVPFSPTNLAPLAAFRLRYGVTNQDLVVLGPYQGDLSNGSGRISLERPQYPDLPGETYSWVIVDEVIYADRAPWPAEADGTGSSLQRAAATAPGNNPAHWLAAPPTSGAANRATSSPDSDLDGLPDDWEQAHNLDLYVADGDDGPAGDPDHDGWSNREEYLAATDPQQPTIRFVSVGFIAEGVRLQFNVPAGRAVVVEYRDSLTSGGWKELTTLPGSPTAGPAEVTDSNAPSQPGRFYRLVAMDSP